METNSKVNCWEKTEYQLFLSYNVSVSQTFLRLKRAHISYKVMHKCKIINIKLYNYSI